MPTKTVGTRHPPWGRNIDPNEEPRTAETAVRATYLLILDSFRRRGVNDPFHL